MFAVVVVLVVANAPGWPAFKEAFFNREVFRESLEVIPKAFLVNVKIFLIAEVLILPARAPDRDPPQPPGAGVLPAAGARGRLRGPLPRGARRSSSSTCSDSAIPALGLSWMPIDTLFWGIVALVLVYSAYVSEVYRAGIESVHPSQDAAARSLGLSHLQALRFVVLPQAVRRVIPPLLNDFIGLQKDTALVGLLGVVEAFRQSQIEAATTFNFTPYVVTAILFILLTIPLARLTDWLVARDRRRQLAAAGAQ